MAKVIVEACALLAEQEGLKETVSESMKGAGIMGVSALIGGLLGGKEGMLIGGALGTALGAMATSDFRSIPEVLREDLTEAQRDVLFKRIKSVLQGVAITNSDSVMKALNGNASMKNNVLQTLINFLRDDMALSV